MTVSRRRRLEHRVSYSGGCAKDNRQCEVQDLSHDAMVTQFGGMAKLFEKCDRLLKAGYGSGV